MESEKQKQSFRNLKSQNKVSLVLHNDDVNTFDFVISNLMEVCEHSLPQAEQCALITHHKGKCEIKLGESSVLKPMQSILQEKGLIVTLEDEL